LKITSVIIILILLSFNSVHSYGNDSIPFLENTYEEALVKAENEYKPLLFYFHGDHCYDCTVLDSLYKTERLKEYLSLNYVNVKIEYNEPIGIRLKNKFNIKSLPSLVFLNEDQELIFIIDEDFTESDILNFARWTTNPSSRPSEFSRAFEQNRKIKNWEQVDSLFEFNVVDNLVIEKENATTLYHQTKMHKILNDGKVEEHLEKYLKTQDNWKSSKNMQFILDYASDPRSKAFEFLADNRKDFNEQFEKGMVDSLIEGIVHNRLYNLQPPPKFEETKKLMKLVSPKNTYKRTYEYLIDLKLSTENYIEYLFLERKYIKKFAPKDHVRMMRLINIYLEKITENYNADYYLKIALTANKLEPNNIDYLLSTCQLYIKKGDKCGALNSAVRAYSLTVENGDDAESILQTIREIDKMH